MELNVRVQGRDFGSIPQVSKLGFHFLQNFHGSYQIIREQVSARQAGIVGDGRLVVVGDQLLGDEAEQDKSEYECLSWNASEREAAIQTAKSKSKYQPGR